MSQLQRDLQATAEDLVADAERLQEIEIAKAALPAGDPLTEKLSEDALALAHRMVPKAVAELELTQEAASGEGLD